MLYLIVLKYFVAAVLVPFIHICSAWDGLQQLNALA